ncbi:hypothetical protein [Lacticaseibacillus paracasei]|uniref:hypothetical protein n=1 Tax=Lacticaseibacillus paracasei TaxID=1597 RepID=UPI001C7D7888|nr:hypothetical protein [Lacticaseibacillus paracasei]MBX4166313.1 hypothetical protein [Lacticaseibacillus paracasei]
MLCKHHFSKNGQVFFHIFWVVTLIMQSRNRTVAIDISTQVRPISRFIRDEMTEHNYHLTLEQRTLLFDIEGKAQDVENKFQTAADWFLF